MPTITIELEKQLTLQNNDILIVNCEKQEDLEILGRTISRFFPDLNILLISSESIKDIELANEELMRKYGWEKINGFAIRS